MATSQRKPQGRGFAANPAVGGRGSRHEALVKGGSPGQPRPADGTPARQTVGFNTVNERLLFAAQLLIGYTVQVQVGGANSSRLGTAVYSVVGKGKLPACSVCSGS